MQDLSVRNKQRSQVPAGRSRPTLSPCGGMRGFCRKSRIGPRRFICHIRRKIRRKLCLYCNKFLIEYLFVFDALNTFFLTLCWFIHFSQRLQVCKNLTPFFLCICLYLRASECLFCGSVGNGGGHDVYSIYILHYLRHIRLL